MAKARKLTKNEKRRLRRKQKKAAERAAKEKQSSSSSSSSSPLSSSNKQSSPIKIKVEEKERPQVIEYVPEKLELLPGFENVFTKFASAEMLSQGTTPTPTESSSSSLSSTTTTTMETPTPSPVVKNTDAPSSPTTRPSRKERKRLQRLKVAELKKFVKCPEVVEVHDVTAADPHFLIQLKSIRNTVPVPRNWLQKRKYLQGKRGIEKAPFQLPAFIRKTGIEEMRASIAEKDEGKNLRQRARERMTPKLNKVSIDYQVLHNAFFKFQTKPEMTRHGQLYYEGKEFETKSVVRKPGVLSEELRRALGMNAGNTCPPPWLINMQRYGPPPSYKSLSIPGLNAPIPPGASFGYHPGGWGKPPVDALGRPLYGDVFAEADAESARAANLLKTVELSHWGEVEDGDDEEETDSDEEGEQEGEEGEEGEEEEANENGIEQDNENEHDFVDGTSSIVSQTSGTTFTSGISSIDIRKGTSSIDIRKGTASSTPQLYQVLEQKSARIGSADKFGSSHQYVLPGNGVAEAPKLEKQIRVPEQGNNDGRIARRKRKGTFDDDEFSEKKFKF